MPLLPSVLPGAKCFEAPPGGGAAPSSPTTLHINRCRRTDRSFGIFGIEAPVVLEYPPRTKQRSIDSPAGMVTRSLTPPQAEQRFDLSHQQRSLKCEWKQESLRALTQEKCRCGVEQGNETREQEDETVRRRESAHAQMVERPSRVLFRKNA